MNTNLVLQTLKKINKGQWFKLSYTSDVPLMAQAKRQGFVCYKRTTMTARYGVRYANISSVKQRLEMKAQAGEPVSDKHELAWGNWASGYEGIMIEHKGQNYLRIATSPNKFKSQFFVNGEPISKEGLMALGIVQPSYFKKPEQKPEVITIKMENIESIG